MQHTQFLCGSISRQGLMSRTWTVILKRDGYEVSLHYRGKEVTTQSYEKEPEFGFNMRICGCRRSYHYLSTGLVGLFHHPLQPPIPYRSHVYGNISIRSYITKENSYTYRFSLCRRLYRTSGRETSNRICNKRI